MIEKLLNYSGKGGGRILGCRGEEKDEDFN
jgi:hypothetical protein